MKTKHIVAVLLMCLSVTLLGAISFAQPPSYTLEKERGSWCDEMRFTIVTSAAAQMVTLMNHQVDAGWPPTPADIPTLRGAGYMMASTGSFSMDWYAINNRVEPLDDPVFRTALAYCMDKETIYPTLYGPLVTPIYNWAPPAHAFWCNPAVAAAFPRFNLQTAINTLVAGGYTPVDAGNNPVANPQPGNIHHWHMPGTTTDIRNLEQAVPNTSTLGMQVSQWIESDLHSIGLPIYHTPLPFHYILHQQWLAPPYLNWDCTIGISLTFDVDPVYDLLYHSDSIPYANFWGLDDAQVDAYIDAAMATLDSGVAQQNIWDCGVHLSQLMPMIPMITPQRWTCATGPYSGQPGVFGWVNMIGYGGMDWHNLWCKLFSRREHGDGSPYPINNWLLGQDAQILNPLTSSTNSEWQLLSLVYSTLLQMHPYTLELMPWCVTEMPLVQLWNGTHTADKDDTGFTNPTPDPSPIGSPGYVVGEKMRWTLRYGMTWHDGEKVKAEDVEFCLDLLVHQNNQKYESTHRYIHDVNVMDDYGFEVYYTARNLWAVKDVGDICLLAPKHIWKPYIASEDGILWTADDRDHRFWTGHDTISAWGYTAPVIITPSGKKQLTHLIGNGPFIYPYGGWTPGVSMHLVRFPGWHYTRILRGDNNLDGIVDTLDLWAPLYAFGTQPCMHHWHFQNSGLKADQGHPGALIDGRDVMVVCNDWGYYWWPYSTLPP